MAAPPWSVADVFMTSVVKPSVNVRFWTVRSGVVTFHALMMCMIRVELPPLKVTKLPPSIVVSLVMGTSAVTVIVTGAVPQLNVMTPPFATAASRAASVQLAPVPVPTTVVGFETSTSGAGSVQVCAGGGGGAPSPLGGGAASLPGGGEASLPEGEVASLPEGEVASLPGEGPPPPSAPLSVDPSGLPWFPELPPLHA